MMQHSTKIVAMLLMAICLMGILPLSVYAVTPNPQPYYGMSYNLVTLNNDIEFLICHTDVIGDDLPRTYIDTKCYTDDLRLTAQNVETAEETEILFTTTGTRAPITWLYTGHHNDEGVITETMIGATSIVLNTGGKNYNFAYVLINRIMTEEFSAVAIALNRSIPQLENGSIAFTIDEWVTAGASAYYTYIYFAGEGVAFGADTDIAVSYFEGYELTNVFDRQSVLLATNLVLNSEQIPDIVIDRYTLLARSFVSQIDKIWGNTSWLSVVPIIVFGGTICLIVILIIKKIFEGR